MLSADHIRTGEAHAMRIMSTSVLQALLLALFVLAPAGGARAQRLHDEGRDKKAQEAAALAEEITSRSTFDKQLKNLDTLSKRDVDLHFRGAKRQMELEISGFRTWGQVREFVDSVKVTLNKEDFISAKESKEINDDLEKKCEQGRATDLGKAICMAEAELGVLNKAVKDSEERGKALEEELKTRLEQIGVVDSLADRALTFLKSQPKKETIAGLSDVFVNLSKSYVNYTNKLREIQNQPKDELRLLLQRIAVETLQLEADHWETVAEIQLRRGEEQKDLLLLVSDFESRMAQIPKCVPTSAKALDGEALGAEQIAQAFDAEKITVTFGKAQKEVEAWKRAVAKSERPGGPPVPEAVSHCQITNPEDPSKTMGLHKEELAGYMLQGLYSAAALAARGATPMRLAQLRLAQEEHRYSIRQSAIVARGYELALSSGTKRLARFYAGGIKPEKIAQLVYTAATVAIPAVIAGK